MLAWLAARHPATREASCIQRFLDFDYEVIGQHLPVFDSATRIEWSTPLVEADSVDGLYVLPEYGSDNDEEPRSPYVTGEYTAGDYAKYRNIILVLEEFARRTVLMLNKLNKRLQAWHFSQIASVELTFRLRSPPERHLLLHCDNDDYDPRSAVFMVALSNGSAATVLSGAPNVTASDTRCRDADSSTTAACASDRAGAATYYPIHACHSRPVGTAPRDVVAVHVRWTELFVPRSWTHGVVPTARWIGYALDESSGNVMISMDVEYWFLMLLTVFLFIWRDTETARLLREWALSVERAVRRHGVMRRLRRLRHNAVFLMVQMLRDKTSQGAAMALFAEVILSGLGSLPIHRPLLVVCLLLRSLQ